MKVTLLKYVDLWIFWHFTTKLSKQYHERIQLPIFRSIKWQLLSAFLGARQQINGMINITIHRLWISCKIREFAQILMCTQKQSLRSLVRSFAITNTINYFIVLLDDSQQIFYSWYPCDPKNLTLVEEWNKIPAYSRCPEMLLLLECSANLNNARKAYCSFGIFLIAG